MRRFFLLPGVAILVILLHAQAFAGFPLHCRTMHGEVDYIYVCNVIRADETTISCSISRLSNSVPLDGQDFQYLCTPAQGHENDWVCTGQEFTSVVNVAGAVDMNRAGLCTAVCSRNACTDWK